MKQNMILKTKIGKDLVEVSKSKVCLAFFIPDSSSTSRQPSIYNVIVIVKEIAPKLEINKSVIDEADPTINIIIICGINNHGDH